MKICDLFESTNNLYHATYRPYLNSIMKTGLGSTQNKNWSSSKSGVIYLATTPEVAESYAETAEDVPEEYLDQIVILIINSNQLNKSLLIADSNVIDGTDTFEYRGVIPPSAIKVWQ